MKRFHVHVAVTDLAASTRFYAALFGCEPSVSKPDYAKWMLDDPRVNFAISQRGDVAGVNHLGLQAESAAELEEIHTRIKAADATVIAEHGAHCCYAKSDKYWVQDPSGIAWESFHSLADIPVYGGAQAAMPGVEAHANRSSGAVACGAGTCCPAPLVSPPALTCCD